MTDDDTKLKEVYDLITMIYHQVSMSRKPETSPLISLKNSKSVPFGFKYTFLHPVMKPICYRNVIYICHARLYLWDSLGVKPRNFRILETTQSSLSLNLFIFY